VEIDFAALSFIHGEETHYRYQMVGFEEGWVDGGSYRQAHYTDLPPGSYRFMALADSPYGKPSRTPASVEFIVHPDWWQQPWVRAGAVLFLGVLIWLVHAGKVRRIRARGKAQEEFSRRLIASQEDERKRLAGELHDSLNQNLLLMKNRLILVEEQLPEGDERRTALKQIEDFNAKAIAEVRGISQNLRPYQLDRLGLTKAISDTVETVSESTGIPIRCAAENIDGVFSSEFESHIFRMIQESLNNMIKHSDASEARVGVTRNDREVVIHVIDDGRGFDLHLQKDKSFGLSNLRERTRMMQGTFSCKSSPGHGTELTFRLPAGDAVKRVRKEEHKTDSGG
ncbi:MAG: ATP-binding protein, partial [Verrucomicrobiota bacterium]